MKKANAQGTPGSFFNVQVSPDELRTIANRMETEMDNTMEGQEVRYELTRDIVLTWEPELNKQRTNGRLLPDTVQTSSHVVQ